MLHWTAPKGQLQREQKLTTNKANTGHNKTTNRPVSSWEAASRSVLREMPCLLWKPKAHYVVDKSLHWILPWTTSVPSHAVTDCVPQMYLNVILPRSLNSGVFEGCFPFRFSDWNFVRIFHLSHSCCMSSPSHPPRFDDRIKIKWAQIMKLIISDDDRNGSSRGTGYVVVDA
jgi:hypothetical protein